MAKDLALLRQQTRTYLDEVVQADWTDTEVDREINVGYMKVYSAVCTVYEDYYSTTATANLVANQQEYALPSNFYKIRRLQVNYNPDADPVVFKRALPVPLDSILQSLDGSVAGIMTTRNSAYYLRGQILGLLPVPTASATGGLALWYIKIVSELSSSTDEINIPFPDRYYDAISLEAAGTLLRKGQQEEIVAAKYLSEAELRRQQMQIELKDRISDDTKSIVVTDQVFDLYDFY